MNVLTAPTADAWAAMLYPRTLTVARYSCILLRRYAGEKSIAARPVSRFSSVHFRSWRRRPRGTPCLGEKTV
jgi:hypothetical protein